MPLLGKGVFTDSLHSLFTALHLESDIPVLDAASATATAALTAGASVVDTITQVSAEHNIPDHHAAIVVAAAAQHLIKPAPKA